MQKSNKSISFRVRAKATKANESKLHCELRSWIDCVISEAEKSMDSERKNRFLGLLHEL